MPSMPADDGIDSSRGDIQPPDREGSALAEFQLFRPEALIEARETFGRPAPVMGLSSAVLTTFLVVLLIGVVIVLSIVRYSRKETVVGMLEPTTGAIQINAPRAGVIGTVHVKDDQTVRGGQPLVTLESESTTAGGNLLSSLLESATKDQASALRQQSIAISSSIATGLRQLEQRRFTLKQQLGREREGIQLLRERLRLAEETAIASRQLNERQYLSTIVLRQREDAVLVSRQALLAAEQNLTQTAASIAQVGVDESKLSADIARERAGLSLQLAQLRERDASATVNARVQLVAPRDGRIALLHAKQGASVQTNTNIAMIVPTGSQLQAELWVPSSAIGFVRKGDAVRLMYEAFPYEQFGAGKGRVIEIDRSPTSPMQLGDAIKAEEGMYRVVVALTTQSVDGYGNRWPLVPGMRLRADIVLEGQTLLEWIFNQVRASAKRGEA